MCISHTPFKVDFNAFQRRVIAELSGPIQTVSARCINQFASRKNKLLLPENPYLRWVIGEFLPQFYESNLLL